MSCAAVTTPKDVACIYTSGLHCKSLCGDVLGDVPRLVGLIWGCAYLLDNLDDEQFLQHLKTFKLRPEEFTKRQPQIACSGLGTHVCNIWSLIQVQASVGLHQAKSATGLCQSLPQGAETTLCIYSLLTVG